MSNKNKSLPWYHKGLHFQCTECGECCAGGEGYVWVSEKEILSMAQHLNLSVEEFSSRYLKKVGRRWSLVDRPRTSRSHRECIFLRQQRCSIYEVRPTQCRTFPWWPQNLSSPQAWRKAARRCEGMQERERIVDLEEISTQLEEQERSSEICE